MKKIVNNIKQWMSERRKRKLEAPSYHTSSSNEPQPETFSREQMENVYLLGYNDGKRDGLAVAREQATKSLKEILWQQNQNRTR